jgi:hypothetical protein
MSAYRITIHSTIELDDSGDYKSDSIVVEADSADDARVMIPAGYVVDSVEEESSDENVLHADDVDEREEHHEGPQVEGGGSL